MCNAVSNTEFSSSLTQESSRSNLGGPKRNGFEMDEETRERSVQREIEEEMERERKAHLDRELMELKQEADDILKGTYPPMKPEMDELEEEYKNRRSMCDDLYKMRLFEQDTLFECRVKRAQNDKAVQRLKMMRQYLKTNIWRKKKFAAHAGKKRRVRELTLNIKKTPTSERFSDFEKHRTLRFMCTPEEIREDIASMLLALEGHNRRSNGFEANSHDKLEEDVQILDGRLHYIDTVYSVGDVIAVHGTNLQSPRKYKGELTQINSKDIHIQEATEVEHRVYHAHLRSGRTRIRKLS